MPTLTRKPRLVSRHRVFVVRMLRVARGPAAALSLGLALGGRTAAAQQRSADSAGAPALRVASGAVYDSATGLPLMRGSVCVWLRPKPSYFQPRCGRLDGGGRFRIDSLPSRPDTLTVGCDPVRGMMGRAVARVPIDLAAGDAVDLAVPVSTAGCDSRPVVAITGEFRGIYTPGFESSGFVPCDGGPGAWVTFALDSAGGRGPKWPRPNDRYYPTYYVRWRGTLSGPGHYGHMGVSAYELIVNRVLEVRRATRRSCP